MGMFDYITCEIPLPEWPEGKRQVGMQTKSFDAPCMNHYKIDADGYLQVQSVEFEYQKDDSVTGIAYQALPQEYSLVNYTGMIEFYHYYNHPDYTYEEAYAFEAGFIDYEVDVQDGKVIEIRCVDKREARELSTEEIEERAEKYRKQVEENRKRMVAYRKSDPSTTQKLVDDIADLIKPNTAIADEVDYGRILNNIDALIKKWRLENDPWYEE